MMAQAVYITSTDHVLKSSRSISTYQKHIDPVHGKYVFFFQTKMRVMPYLMRL